MAALVGLTTVCGAAAAPTAFTLQFAGAHIADTSLTAGIRHEGRFTAAPPLCPSGTAVDIQDVEIEPLTVMRRHTCDDGSGSFVAFMPSVLSEHGGTGTWKIIDGTGKYATLRGVGTYSGHIVSGDPARFDTVVYTTSWQGVVDFDDVAPALTTTAQAKRLRKPARTYLVRTTIDAHEESVTYSVDIRAGRSFLALMKGTAASGETTSSARIRAPRLTRAVKVIVLVSDSVGNETTTTLQVKLR